jgi:hypothetical protein
VRAKTFVAINDPVHALIRKVTRRTPLAIHTTLNGSFIPQYQIAPDEIPDAYYSLAVFHTIGGLSVEALQRTRWKARVIEKESLLRRANYFDAVRLDRRCARDLRVKLRKDGPGLVSAELLAYGVGTLRARNDDALEQTHRYLWSQHGRVHPRGQRVYAQIRALHLNSLPLLHSRRKESFDSTNVIYGDVLGELEQLWDRRADTAFLEGIARSLQALRASGEIAAYLSPPLNLSEVIKLHLRAQSLWRTPPASGRALLRRIDYLLEHIQVDNCPCTFFRRDESEVERHELDSAPGEWNADCSGYDGWLSKN